YRLPVRFRESIQRLYADGARLFVEVGPSPYLTGFVRDSLKHQPHVAVASDDRRRDDLTPLRHLLATLFVRGAALDLSPLFGKASSAPERPSPYLSTAVPIIRLDDAELQPWREEWSNRAARAAPGAPAAPSAPSAPVAVAESVPAGRSAPAATANRRQIALQQHLALMREFLGQQERVMVAWLSRRQR
ncbi:MAG: type I polyketide synthase, partial [Candidatus Competibacter sp.]|nr:type I polyketide synthase [Candidatus Competibacter sp.]